jgi:flagellar assembly protein FliH
MATATRYLFNRSFGTEDDAPGVAEFAGPALIVDPEPEPQDPAIFTQEDLDRVRAEALSFGRKQGAAEAAGTADQRIARTLEQIAEGLGRVRDALGHAGVEQAKDATAVALAVIRKLFPETSRRHGLTEIAGVVDAVIGRIIDKPKVTVRVAESLQHRISEQLSAIAEAHGFAGQISIVGDGTVAEGDCRVAWAGGGATRDSAAIWREIDAAIGRTLGPVDLPAGCPADDGKPAQHDPDNADTTESKRNR